MIIDSESDSNKSNLKEFLKLRSSYMALKAISPERALSFLDSVVDYCKLIEFDLHNTQIIIGLITGCEPIPGENWNDVRDYDEDEVFLE
jgi:hypothetical protein